MKYGIDLIKARFRTIAFEDSCIAFQIPETMKDSLSLLVRGVTVIPPDRHLEELLRDEVRERLPDSLHLAGWGVLTFAGVVGGKIDVAPFEPGFRSVESGFLKRDGRDVILSRSWPPVPSIEEETYCIESFLEDPCGWMTLDIAAAGAVQLVIETNDLITQAMLHAEPALYSYDRFRQRQLKALLNEQLAEMNKSDLGHLDKRESPEDKQS